MALSKTLRLSVLKDTIYVMALFGLSIPFTSYLGFHLRLHNGITYIVTLLTALLVS